MTGLEAARPVTPPAEAGVEAGGAPALSVSEVRPDQVDLVWPEIAPKAAAAIRHVGADDLTAEGIRARLRDGRFLLWVVHDDDRVVAFVVLNVVQRPEGRVLVVVLIAGARFQDWAATVQALLQDFMRLVGARRMESCSRKGMEKWMRALGWRRRAVVMEFVPSSTSRQGGGTGTAPQEERQHG